MSERVSLSEKLKAKRKAEAEAAKNVVVVEKNEKESNMSENIAEIVESETAEIKVSSNWRSVQSAADAVGTNPALYTNEVRMIELDPNRQSLANVVIVTAERAYRDYSAVMAILDIINPDIVILDELTQVARMARSWALSRSKQFVIVSAEWDQLGNEAGPIRNQQVLDMVRDKIDQDNIKAIQVIFDGIEFDRAVASFIRTAEIRNQPMRQVREFNKFVIPLMNANHYLDMDTRASGAQFRVGTKWMELPEPVVMIGARQVNPNAPYAQRENGGPDF